MSRKCLIDEVDHVECFCDCVTGENENLRMTDGEEIVVIDERNEEAEMGGDERKEEEEMEENHLADVVDLSVGECFDRFGLNSVQMLDGEVEAFLDSYSWSPFKTNWEDPEVGETVLGTELIDWVYDYKRLGSEGGWFKMVPNNRKRVPEPGSREAFNVLLDRCEESGWTTFSSAGCLMIKFRDLRSMLREGSDWVRNEDPRAGLVLCDDGR